MELYFGTQYVKVTAKGLNESAENAADDSSILTQKMKDLLNVDPEILAHVLDSSASLDTSVMNIINNNNVTDSPKDDAEEASEIGGENGGQEGGNDVGAVAQETQELIDAAEQAGSVAQKVNDQLRTEVEKASSGIADGK